MPDTDDADTYIMPAALCLRQLAIDRGRPPTPEHILEQVTFWCEKWAFEFLSQIPALVARLCKSRKRGIGQADHVAKALHLSDADRTRLGIRTIGAYDVDRKARAKRRAEKKRMRDCERARLKRAAKGAVTRQQYLADHSLSRSKPWEAEGISRATFMRRRKQIQNPKRSDDIAA